MKRWLDVCLAGTLAAVVLACGDELVRPVGELLVDAGRRLTDGAAPGDAAIGGDSSARKDSGPLSDARAQSECSTCSITGPIEVQAPLRVITADTDLGQLASGTVGSDASWSKLADGPFVITDLAPTPFTTGGGSSYTVELVVADSAGCDTNARSLVGAASSSFVSAGATAAAAAYAIVAGGRYRVPAGKIVCGRGWGNWSGFKPY